MAILHMNSNNIAPGEKWELDVGYVSKEKYDHTFVKNISTLLIFY